MKGREGKGREEGSEGIFRPGEEGREREEVQERKVNEGRKEERFRKGDRVVVHEEG